MIGLAHNQMRPEAAATVHLCSGVPMFAGEGGRGPVDWQLKRQSFVLEGVPAEWSVLPQQQGVVVHVQVFA